MSTWDDLLADSKQPVVIDEKIYGNRGIPSAQCTCGRFAKFLSSQHTYNGQFNGYEYTVNCSRCGVVTVDCV